MGQKIAELSVEEFREIIRDEVGKTPSSYLETIIERVLKDTIPKLPFWIKAEKHYNDHAFLHSVRTIWGYVWKAGAGILGIFAGKWLFFR